MPKKLVIVESPTKVKKLQAFLGPDYKVMASMGHVRDLPAKAAEVPAKLKKEDWSSLGVNVGANFEPLYVVPTEKRKQVKALKEAYKDADALVIATDADREGESIGWHLVQLLGNDKTVTRMTFTEITAPAIQEAVKHLKQLDENLVAAQETRRVLDRLYGYTLSPLLWKKIARGLSAGRVQSVAVRLLVMRELERLAFRKGFYWDLKAQLQNGQAQEFSAQLVKVADKRVASGKDFDEHTGKLKTDADVLLLDEQQARDLKNRLEAAEWVVQSVETTRKSRHPYAPFITSTLQQEANRKLRMSARQTMQTAQRLYENGHITYMRTDSAHLSGEAIGATRGCIERRYGKDYLSERPRQYSSKSKTAQEAHEAIRPAGVAMQTGEELGLKGDEKALYDMIWKRTMATQMAEARLLFHTVQIMAGDAEFRASGKTVEFPGFFRAYVEGVDDPEAKLDDQEDALPELTEGERLQLNQLEALSHETKPPARYTEATLVKTLEAKEIGRPSTYASIISTIQDRGYVNKLQNQLVPTFVAMAVTGLLEEHFPNLVDIGFTARMENTLDEIAVGEGDRSLYLMEFYSGEAGLAEQVKSKEAQIDARAMCTLRLDGIDFDVRVGRYGPYIEISRNGETVTVSLPADCAPGDLTNEQVHQLVEQKERGPQSVGTDPETGLPIYVLNGPFGPYIQLGEAGEEGKKPKRVSIPKTMDASDLSYEQALGLLGLPRRLGEHPETGKVVRAGIGRFGPYVVHDGVYKSLGKHHDVLSVDLEEAVELLKQARPRAKAKPLRELGAHPEDGQAVGMYDGRYGPYVKHGKTNASLPKDTDLQTLTLEEAVALLDAKAGKSTRKAVKKKAVKKKTAKKKAVKKAAKKSDS